MASSAFFRMMMYDQSRLDLTISQYDQECDLIKQEYQHVTPDMETMPDELREWYRSQLNEMLHKLIRASSNHYVRAKTLPTYMFSSANPQAIQARSISLIAKIRSMIKRVK
jgi:hypothetical protein